MKHTKGKQKIEIKKMKAYRDRMVTFSKRKSAIFKKMNEIVSLCNVETAFLVFTETGKPYSFANLSLNEAFNQLKNPLIYGPSVSTSTNPIVEAYERLRVEELMKKYIDRVEELDMENEKEFFLRKSKEEKKLENMWWNISSEGVSVDKLKRIHQSFLDFHVSLNAFGEDRDGSSSGQGRQCLSI